MCAVDGSGKVYFRVRRSKFRHAPNCPFRASNDEFDADQLAELLSEFCGFQSVSYEYSGEILNYILNYRQL